MSPPGIVELRDETLYWRWLNDAGRLGARPQAPRDLLNRFVALSDRSAGAFADFARQWGVLKLCRHDLPATHNPACEWVGYLEDRDGRWDGWEPIAIWRQFAREARAALEVASSVHLARAISPIEWAAMLAFWQSPPPVPEQPADGRSGLEAAVDRWLELSGLRPLFVWPLEGPPSVTFGQTGELSPFAVVALQLALAVSRSESMVFCSNCQRAYLPSRRPRSGKRNYCQACQAAHVPARDAKRDQRERNRRAKQT